MIKLDVWLYGPLARFGGAQNKGSHAQVAVELPEGSAMRDLLVKLGMPHSEKGITFVNGNLTDTPGLLADLDHVLRDGDRIAFFHQLSMWPFQYRFGAAIGSELKDAMRDRDDGGLYHTSSGGRPAGAE